ncbi:hypothetical protein, partial [Myxococcus sp. AB025B]|uniref:hypothetical protein n=1 Tax=Myxococcus sp. AB025B TaxID=2562794 RepID=UPI001890FFFB
SKLFEAAKGLDLGVCASVGRCAPGNWKLATKETGLAREFLFDFTMYHDFEGDYAQPEIILEHENVWHLDAFMEDFWKLMFGYAPLRVMIGYHRDMNHVNEYIDAIRRFDRERRWRYPAGVEDLVLIGHRQMEARGFRVVNR